MLKADKVIIRPHSWLYATFLAVCYYQTTFFYSHQLKRFIIFPFDTFVQLLLIEYCRRRYYMLNASPYQVWSRSFASDNGKPHQPFEVDSIL
jgi:hypothetical protein